MIERYIKNDLTLKRWRRFKKVKRSIVSAWLFVFILMLSVTAEFWANSKPLILSFHGSLYFPIFKTYHPSVFGQMDSFVTDYRALFAEEDWSVWPAIAWDPYESNTAVTSYPAPPTWRNWFGTDDRGRDVFSRLIYGFRYSIGYALLVWMASYLVGTIVGALMGYLGGRVDLVGQRIVDIFESMPVLLLLITLVSIFSASMTVLVIFSTMFGWMFISAYVRAEFLKLRKREFVESARAQGVSQARIIFKHIMPNALGPVLTFSPFTIAAGISALAALDYLGFGLPPPTPSWGEMLQQAQNYFTLAWWLALYPSLAMIFTLTILNLIGEGVRDAFDPRK